MPDNALEELLRGWTHILRNQARDHDEGGLGLGQHGGRTEEVAIGEAHGEAKVLGAAVVQGRHDARGHFAIAPVKEAPAASQDVWRGRVVDIAAPVGRGRALRLVEATRRHSLLELLEGVDGLRAHGRDIGQGGTGEIGSVGWVGGRSGLQGNIESNGRAGGKGMRKEDGVPLDAGVVVCPLVTACLFVCPICLLAYLWQPAYGGCLEQSLAQAPRYSQLSRVICDRTRGTCARVRRHGVPVDGLDLFRPVQDAQRSSDDGVPHVGWHARLAAQGVQKPWLEGGGVVSGHCGGGGGGEVATVMNPSGRTFHVGAVSLPLGCAVRTSQLGYLLVVFRQAPGPWEHSSFAGN